MPRAALVDTSEQTPEPRGARRFASPAVRAAIRRRMAEMVGMVLALAGLALMLALATHDPSDPSLNTATEQGTHNLVGPAGAVVSDLLLQNFGWAAYLTSLTMLAWAWRLAIHKGLSPFAGRLASLLAGLPCLAAVLMLAPLSPEKPVDAGPGGALGPVVMEWVQLLLSAFGPVGKLVGDIGLGLLTGWLVFVALGIPLASWRRAGRVAGGAAGTASVAAAKGSAALVGRAMRREPRMDEYDDEPQGQQAPAWATAAPRPQDMQNYQAPHQGRAERPRGLMARLMGGWRRRPVRSELPLSAVLRNAEARAAEPRRPLPVAGMGREMPRETRAEPMMTPAGMAPAALPSGPSPARVAERNQPPRKSKMAEQPTLDLRDGGGFRMPPLSLLNEPPARRAEGPAEDALQGNARMLESVLEDYGVRGRIVEVRPGPVVTLYELEPAPGTKSARVIGLADDIARSMSVLAVRIATVPGRNVIGIEMPNAVRETVYFSEMMGSDEWARNSSRLPMALGKDIGGVAVIADLARMPHLLIAGTTGSGKSVAVNTMILSLLYRHTPEECRFIMIDPKMLELSVYDRIPHLLAPVVTEPPKAIGALKWTVREMERRYKSMSQLGVRNIAGYNEKVQAARAKGEALTRRVQTGFDPDTGKPVFEDVPLALEPLPMIVVIIDEVADLMLVAGKDIEAAVQRLAQMARAAGIHVIMATQRPSVDVITGTIKANFPTRISFQVTSKIDSRTILGEQGAEQLLGQGDMLHMAGGGRISRVHGPFVSDSEVERVVEWLREQGEPSYVEEVTETEEEDGSNPALSGIAGASDAEKSLFDQAVDVVAREGKASTSFIQRHLNIGYNRAAKLIEQMEKEGIVGAANHVGKREVLVRRSHEDD